jgi:membrane protease YdiL (CAAX protease family)
MGAIAVAWILSAVPRLRSASIGFKYARRDGLAALFLGGASVIFAFVFSTQQLGGLSERVFPVSGPAADLARPLFVALVSLLPFIAAMLTRGQPPRSIGWSGSGFRAGLTAGIALALLTIFLRNRVMDVLGGISTPQSIYLLFAIGIALAEETIFRGYIQLRLTWWMGQTRGWLATSLLYALFRLPLLFVSGNLLATLFYLLIALGQGLVAGYIMRKTGHVLAPALYRAASIWMNVFV